MVWVIKWREAQCSVKINGGAGAWGGGGSAMRGRRMIRTGYQRNEFPMVSS